MKRLQSLSYKTLFTILFFSLAGIVFFLKIGGKTQKVSAAWWDDMWHYRKAISITNSSGSNLTDFQVSVSIGTSQLIADGKMQSDCDDIRLTDINGNLLPYWIEENNPGCNQLTDTKIWLKANSLPTSGATVYIYYGNTSANNNENGDNVFEYFDNFNDANKTNSNWTTTGTGFTITNGNLYHSTTLEPSNSFASYTINNSSSFTNGVIESRLKPASCGSSYGKGLTARYTDDNNQYVAGLEAWTANQTHIGKRVGSGWTNLDQDSLTCDTNTWYSLQWTLNGTNQYLTANGVASSAVDSSFSSGKVGIEIDNRETPVGAYWDYFFVHKYASSDPTPTLQSEELGTGPIAYWKFDEGSGTTAYDSAGNNNGVIGGASWKNEENCISGKCLNYTGSAYVNLGNPANFRIQNNSVTIETWVNFDSLDYVNNTGKLIGFTGKGAPDTAPGVASSGFWFSYDNRNNRNSFTYTCFGNSAGGYSGGGNNFGGYNYTFNTNTWYHLAVTISNNEGRLYINGKQIGAAKTFSGLQLNNISDNLYLGRTSAGYHIGSQDEVKIYPYARTAAQIKLDYNSRGSMSGSSANLGIKSNTAPSLKSSLVAYYKFDEGIGTTVYDSSPQKNLGYFVGTTLPTWSNNCKAGKCINFISTNSNNISTNVNYNNGSEYTISAYIYPTSISGTRVVLGTAMGNNIDAGLVVSGTSNICYHNYSGSGDTNYCSTNSPIILNTWQHVALSMKNNDINIYHNRVNVRNVSVGRTATTNFAIIGGASVDAYSGARYFNGSIDEVKIYNKALTADEIKQDYNANSAIQFGSTNQTIGGTTTSLDYCIPGDTSYCVPPVAEWNFEENTGTTAKDTSGNGNDGTFGTGSSAPTWTVGQNNKGSGIKFDGTQQYINIPSSNSLNINNNQVTLSLWVKLNKLPSQIPGSYSGIYDAASDSYVMYLEKSTGDLKFKITDSDSTAERPSIPESQLTIDKWSHITGVYDGSNGTAKIYLNGQLVDTHTNVSLIDNVLSGQIGRIGDGGSSDRFFDGLIDQVKIYNYARTPAQIAYDYNRGSPIGWWKFDECQGSTVFDASGLGNTGAISIGLSGSQTSLGTCQTGTSAAWTNGATGKINSSLNFDGVDDYISIPNVSQLKFGLNNFSISTWIKGPPSQANFRYIIIKTGSSRYSIETFGNNWFWRLDDDQAHVAQTTVTKTILDNNWHMLTLVVDRTNQKAYSYTDGVLSTTPNNISSLIGDISPPNNLFLGGTSYFSGQIDDVRIYNYALTAEQIKTVYNNGAVNFQ